MAKRKTNLFSVHGKDLDIHSASSQSLGIFVPMIIVYPEQLQKAYSGSFYLPASSTFLYSYLLLTMAKPVLSLMLSLVLIKVVSFCENGG